MKKIYLLFLLFSSVIANAQEPFIVTCDVYTGSTITIPIYGSDNNYSIDFGDGTVLTGQSSSVSHQYVEGGNYTITISGDFHRLSQVPYGQGAFDSVEQWGDIQWSSMEYMFSNYSYLAINATDTPDLSQCTSMKGMFQNTHFSELFNINDWDTSTITDMSFMCKGSNWGSPIDNLNVANVITMEEMFADCSFQYFTPDLSGWDVSNVTNMKGMFRLSTWFNQPIGNWDVSNVTDMSYMFYGITAFNQPLNDWDVSNVTNMEHMLSIAYFNQPLDGWDVSSVTNMKGLFHGAATFNQPLNGWDVSNVTNMSQMFFYADAFNQPLDNWDVSNVTNMAEMFRSADLFNQPLSGWNVSNVTNMEGMFDSGGFNLPLDDWDVSNVLNMEYMFYFNNHFNQDLSDWQFNEDVSLYGFGEQSSFDTSNYDSLLLRFVQLGLESKELTATGLKYCDSGVRNHLINELDWEITGDNLGEECELNTVVGIVRLDVDNDGCDAEDSIMVNFLVNATDGTFSYVTSTHEEGFDLNVLENSYSLSLLNLPNYFTATPATSEITFEGFGNEETLNFCLTANETVNDLNITLLPLEEARPGFETDYQVVVQNMGTQMVAAATVTLSFDETLQNFVVADPAPAATTANQLTFDVTNLQPFESRVINLTTELFTPPTVNGGEISTFTATVTPNDDDYTPADNTFVLQQEVVNSYDPNDKTVLQGERIYTEQADEYLNYIIRFQNTGTASAITVRIEDILHENLDWTTFTPVSASHGYRVEITDGNLVEFIFDDINLPHEAADAEGSNGFIAYKIRPVADIRVGEVMEGNASIFFDYNLPIITNVATTEVITHIEVSVAQANASCSGESDGSASVSVSGGSGEYSYEWSSDEGTEPTAEGLAAGEYTVTITDSYGESITLQVTITQPGAVAVSSQPVDDETTIGGTATFSVTASNVDEYQWQFSPDGENWTSISDGGTAPSYSGTGTPLLNIAGTPLTYDGYSYRALLENGDNCETYSSAGVLEVSDVAGLDGINKLTITMYPNPAKSEVFITIPQRAGQDNFRLSVYDISGRQLIERPVSADLEKVDIEGFAPGMYLFTISSDTARLTQQIIKE